ncbi:MAG TPA: AAA family ATPase [Luteibaculaceae bacterium]|nr:AAA family ATPase [Luteibaculaceae bacterium]
MLVAITGGPGSGKTSVVEELALMGYTTLPEAARQIIQLELQKGSDKLPWKDVVGFSELVYESIRRQMNSIPEDNWVFTDRTAIDVLAYLQAAGKDRPDSIPANPMQNRLYPVVFFAPFWEAIYRADSERRETIVQAKKISEYIYTTYVNLGYQVIELPLADVKTRARFILNQLQLVHSVT